MRRKYNDVAAVIRRKIEHGDYANGQMPGERRIAEELQVSYMTARKAFLQLIQEGLIRRDGVNKTTVGLHGGKGARVFTFAFVSPAYGSLLSQNWYIALERTLAGRNGLLRPVYFAHWEDAAVIESLEHYDGIFLLPALPAEPAHIVERLARSGKPVVVLSSDWSERGFVSIVQRTADSMGALLEHLAGLGHRRIDCFNTQPAAGEVEQAILYWQEWLRRKGLRGELLNDPAEPYGDTLERAHRYAGRLMDGGVWDTTAVVCLTMSAAVGLMRAMADRGMEPGKDAAICALTDVNFCAYLTPSLTSLRDVPLDGFISKATSWMMAQAEGRRGTWDGPLLLKPPAPRLFIGESTTGHPARKTTGTEGRG